MDFNYEATAVLEASEATCIVQASTVRKRRERRNPVQLAEDDCRPIEMWMLISEQKTDLPGLKRMTQLIDQYVGHWEMAAERLGAVGNAVARTKALEEVLLLRNIKSAVVMLDDVLHGKTNRWHVRATSLGLPVRAPAERRLRQYQAAVQGELARTRNEKDRVDSQDEFDTLQDIWEAVERLDLLLRQKDEWDRRVMLKRKMLKKAA